MNMDEMIKKAKKLGFPVKVQGAKALAHRNQEPLDEPQSKTLSTQKPKQNEEETIMNKQENMTPAQIVAKLKELRPNIEVRLSREGDPELSSLLINSYPTSGQSKTDLPPSESGNSPEEEHEKRMAQLYEKGLQASMFKP